jgi:hypothetical protein
MRSKEEIENKLKEYKVKEDYWRKQTQERMDVGVNSSNSYSNRMYWTAKVEALEFVLGIR